MEAADYDAYMLLFEKNDHTILEYKILEECASN